MRIRWTSLVLQICAIMTRESLLALQARRFRSHRLTRRSFYFEGSAGLENSSRSQVFSMMLSPKAIVLPVGAEKSAYCAYWSICYYYLSEISPRRRGFRWLKIAATK